LPASAAEEDRVQDMLDTVLPRPPASCLPYMTTHVTDRVTAHVTDCVAARVTGGWCVAGGAARVRGPVRVAARGARGPCGVRPTPPIPFVLIGHAASFTPY